MGDHVTVATSGDNTDELLCRIEDGDHSAVQPLMDRYRDRLKRMIHIHLDDHLRRRIDASDVVQEALAEAFQRISDYARKRPIAFYPWLRQIGWEKLLQMRQHHVGTKKRSVLRESQGDINLPDDSVMELAERLTSEGTSPTGHLVRMELCARVREALDQLSARDRDVLVIRYLEQLSTRDAVAVLGISEDAFTKRHIRAIRRLRQLLDAREGMGDHGARGTSGSN